MDFKIEYSEKALKQIFRMDNEIVKKLLVKLDQIMELPDPMKRAKRLTIDTEDIFRFRIGDYRVVFRKDAKSWRLVVLVVLNIQHRRIVYKKN